MQIMNNLLPPFYELTNAEKNALIKCKPYIEDNIRPIIENFFILIESYPDTAGILNKLNDRTNMENNLKKNLLGYFDGITDTTFLEFIKKRGETHFKLDVSVEMFQGAFLYFRNSLIQVILQKITTDDQEKESTISGLNKMMAVDNRIGINSYIAKMTTELIKK